MSASPDTWTGAGDGTSWGDPGNWSSGVPSAGAAVVFPAIPAGDASPAIINIAQANGSSINADISSIDVEGIYLFTGNGTTDQSSHLILDNGAAISTDDGATLNIDQNGTFTSDLLMNINGGLTKSGAGDLVVSTQKIFYPNLKTGKLRPVTVDSGTVTLGNSTAMPSTNYTVEKGTTLIVPHDQNPGIGSLNGDGTVEIGDTAPAVSLTINTPAGETDDFSGLIDGEGGTINMEGQGSLTVDRIIPATRVCSRSTSTRARYL